MLPLTIINLRDNVNFLIVWGNITIFLNFWVTLNLKKFLRQHYFPMRTFRINLHLNPLNNYLHLCKTNMRMYSLLIIVESFKRSHSIPFQGKGRHESPLQLSSTLWPWFCIINSSATFCISCTEGRKMMLVRERSKQCEDEEEDDICDWH